MAKLYEIMVKISEYRGAIKTLILIVIFAILAIILSSILKSLKQQMDADRQEKLREDNLKNIDYDTFGRKEKATTLRKVVAADAIDPGPNSYLIISDGGREVFVRTFTVVTLPNRVRFANTFAGLLNFHNCESSIFVNPIAEDEMIRNMDKQIRNLYGEDYTAGKNSNVTRQRSIRGQISDAEEFVSQIEAGNTKFYDVGFLFSLHADSLRELDKATQEFVSVGKKVGIALSNCYSIQAEAFALNGPWNNEIKVDSGKIPTNAIKFFQLDKHSISTLFNYTQMTFSHKNGIILGLDMFTGAPIVYDTFEPSHDGYTIVVAGKVGTGKSAMIKIMVCREILQGMHYVCIDSKQRRGTSEGEYASLATLCNGVNFQISNSSNDVMNIFDISETTRNIKDGNNGLHEVRTLELADKVTMLTNIIVKLVQGGEDKQTITFKENTFLESVISENLTQLYKSFGFIDGDADSLYTVPGAVDAQKDNSTLRNGRPLRIMPTMTDYYKQLLVSARDTKDSTKREIYGIVLTALKDYVRELYYSERSCVFFTKEQVENIPFSETAKAREWKNHDGSKEVIKEIHGVRAYFDGQSSIHIDRECPFTNIDISLLPDSEKDLTRQVALAFINENFIKRNSLSLDMNARMKVIVDEAHEAFKNKYDRSTLDQVVRTARSRNVALVLASQTLREYDNYPETQAILKQATTKFIFKQDKTDEEYLAKAIGLTENQVSMIVDRIGGNDPENDELSNKHRGECCIVDNKSVCFCKVAYRESTEKLAVATDAKGIQEVFAKAAG